MLATSNYGEVQTLSVKFNSSVIKCNVKLQMPILRNMTCHEIVTLPL